MSKNPQRKNQRDFYIEDRKAAWHRQIDDYAGYVFWASAACLLLSLGYLVFFVAAISQGDTILSKADILRLHDSIKLASNVYLWASAIFILASCWLWYDREYIGYVFLLGGISVYSIIPFIIQMLIGDYAKAQVIELRDLAYAQIRNAIFLWLVPSTGFILVNLTLKIATRIKYGPKKDEHEFGSKAELEKDVPKRFLGKCWQMPYCRSFVRKKCPIFLSGKTCWKERVGCMCEEQVIINALKNVPMDSNNPIDAKTLIPYNNKLPDWVKAERCRNCIIYNEHQHQKYSAVAPTVVLGLLGAIVYWHTDVTNFILNSLSKFDAFMMRFAISSSEANKSQPLSEAIKTSSWIAELMLACIIVIMLAYIIKFMEYIVFKLKI